MNERFAHIKAAELRMMDSGISKRNAGILLVVALLTGRFLSTALAAEPGTDDSLLKAEIPRLPPIAFITQPAMGNPDGVVRYHSRHVVSNWGCQLQVLDPGTSVPRTLYDNPKAAIFDMNLSFDAKTIFFTLREGYDDNWHIYEIGTDGKGLRQITTGPYHDFAPAELPNGDLVFVSTRVKSFNMCAWELATSLFTVRRDGTGYRQLTVNTLNEFSPQILPDGQILYTRWEYIDRDVKWRQSLWTVNPDGRNVRLYAGNTKRDPAVFWQARPIPGADAVLATFAPHHGWPLGAIGTVNRRQGPEAPRNIGFHWITQEYPSIGDNAGLTEWAYRDPFPLSSNRFLVSYGGGLKSVDKHFKLYLLDSADHKALLRDDGKLSCTYPLPLVPRPRPPILTAQPWPEGTTTGTFLVQDVYAGMGNKVKRGEIKALRILEQVPKYPFNETGSGAYRVYQMDPVMGQNCFYVRRCLGRVPVEADGSAYFTVPAFRELYIQALDAEGRAVQSMGSAVNLVPGEQQTCVGCHENRTTAPPPAGKPPLAAARPPVTPIPYPWGNNGLIDFVKLVQPVLNTHCVKCHSGIKPPAKLNLSGDKTRWFNMAYDNLHQHHLMYTINLTQNDSQVIPPKQSFTFASRLRGYIEGTAKGHEKIQIPVDDRERIYLWLDTNSNYYDTYARTRPNTPGSRDLWADPWFNEKFMPVFKKNCAECHKHGSDVTSINLTHPEESQALVAHLSKDAGGLGIPCNPKAAPPSSLFQDKTNLVYAALLDAIVEGNKQLLAKPEMDMPGALPVAGPDDWGKWRGTGNPAEKAPGNFWESIR